MLKTFGLFQELNLVDSLLLFVWWMTGPGNVCSVLTEAVFFTQAVFEP